MKKVENIWAELSAKTELTEHKVELANISDLLSQVKEGRKMANKAKISINSLKAQSKTTADLIDNFGNGAYFEVTQALTKIKSAAKELGLENSPEIKELEKGADMLSSLRNELGNGMASNWFKAISKL